VRGVNQLSICLEGIGGVAILREWSGGGVNRCCAGDLVAHPGGTKEWVGRECVHQGLDAPAVVAGVRGVVWHQAQG